MCEEKLFLFSSEFPPGPGGIGDHALNLAKALAAEGKEVVVLSDSREEFVKEEAAFDGDLPFELYRARRDRGVVVGLFSRWYLFVRLLWRCKKGSKVIVSGKFPLWLAAWMRTFFPGRSWYAVLHGSEVNFQRGWKRILTSWSLKRYDRLIAVSGFTKKLAQRQAGDLSNVVVIPNGFDESKINKKVAEKQIAGAPALITVGSISYRKGQHNVVAALPRLLEQWPGLTYHLVGLLREASRVKRLIQKHALQKCVFLHGAVNDEQMVSLLKGADVFIMLSDQDSDGDVEGFGIAILEANALGIPAIGARGCGIEDAVSDGFSGRLVDPHNPEEIADALEDIMANYEQYASGARKWAARFSWKKIVMRYEEALNL